MTNLKYNDKQGVWCWDISEYYDDGEWAAEPEEISKMKVAVKYEKCTTVERGPTFVEITDDGDAENDHVSIRTNATNSSEHWVGYLELFRIAIAEHDKDKTKALKKARNWTTKEV